MATIGNFAGALGKMAKDNAIGAGKNLLGGLKGAMISEASGIYGAYSGLKGLSRSANKNAPPPPSQQADTSNSSPARVGNVISLEMVRQLKGINSTLAYQAKLTKYQADVQKQSSQFAEEAEREKSVRDDNLLAAIKQIGKGKEGKTGDVAGKNGGPNSLLGKLGDIVTDNIGTLIGAYLGGKGVGAAGRMLGGLGGAGGALGGMAGKYPQVGPVSPVKGIASAGARSALVQGVATVGPIILSFLTGPVGLGIMAAGLIAMAATARIPVADSRRRIIPTIDPTAGPSKKADLDPKEAQRLLDDANERAKSENKTEKANAERDLNAFGGRARVEEIAKGNKDPGAAINSGKFLDKVRGAESGGRNIQNPLGGTAGGVYQITDSTWTGNVQKMIDSGDKRFTKADLDPKMKFNEAKARMVAEYITEQNRGGLKSALGKDPTETDLYMAYFLGMGGDNSGAIKFLKAMDKDPSQTAWKLSNDSADSDIINNNAEIFFAKVSRDPNTKKVVSKEGPRSVKDVYDLMNKKIAGAGGGNAAVLGSTGSTKPGTSAGSNTGPYKITRANGPLDAQQVLGNPDALTLTPKGVTAPELTPKGVMAIADGNGSWDRIDGEQTAGGEGGSGSPQAPKPIPVEDKKLIKIQEATAKGLGINPKSGSLVQSQIAKQALLLSKPLFKSNTDIIRDANTQFIKTFRATATTAFTQILTKTLFPKGVGVDRAVAGKDDMYRGQQLQKIFGTDAKINSMSSKLLGKQYGPMFAPMFNQLAQGYLEVGSRIAGKAIFQGIGGLGAEETQSITGQVLGNYAAGNKKLALEQLIYGASGGKESGVALGAETMFAKYGFKNPMEGISYFANVLGEAATSPFNSMMNNNPQASVVFDPRLGYNVYQNGPNRGQRAGPQAGQAYGQNFGGGQLFSPGLNNYGGQPNPYGTTAMAGPPGSYITNATGVAGKLPTQPEYFGQTPQQFANNSKETLALQQAQLDLTKANIAEQGRKDAEKIKTAAEFSNKQIQVSIDASKDASAIAELQAAQAANLTQAQTSADAIITKTQTGELISGLGGRGGSGTGVVQRDANGDVINPNGKGNLFSNETGLGQFGNFAGDMLKNAAGQKLVQSMGIKNPYMQMVANFGIQKLLGKGFDMLGSSGIGKSVGDWASNLFSSPQTLGSIEEPLAQAGGSFLDSILGWFSADGGIANSATARIVGEAGAEAIIPLANPNATKALSAAFGTKETLSAMSGQTDLLTSIDRSLQYISGAPSGSGTSYTGLSSGGSSMGSGFGFDVGLAPGNSVTGTAKSGVNAGKPGAPPTVMDIVEKVGINIAKGYAIRTGAIMAANALVPGLTSGMATAYAGGEGLIGGITAALDYGTAAVGNAISVGLGGAEAGGLLEVGSSGLLTEGLAFLATNPVGWAILGAIAIFSIFGGGHSSPPPKEPKFHAAIYVTGNNNINAIAPMMETRDYHAVPDAYKTLAYGLLRVAFNAVKEAEAISKVASPFDYIYMKIEFNRIAMSVGVGAPNVKTLEVVGANEIYNYDTSPDKMQVNTLAKGVVDAIIAEFKRGTSADAKGQETLDLAAKKISGYSLNELSSGLVSDLTTGTNKLNTGIEKGIFAPSVAESNRISALMLASKNAPNTQAASTGYSGGDAGDAYSIDAVDQIWSMKEGKYVDRPGTAAGAYLLDEQGRPVFDIAGTSAGLTVDDFSSADVVGANRPANVLNMQAPPVVSSASGAGAVVISAPTTSTVDSRQTITYISSSSSGADAARNGSSQVGIG